MRGSAAELSALLCVFLRCWPGIVIRVPDGFTDRPAFVK
jgi:hypothetical protein